MDVRMPDGTILRGVPDGTPKDQILAKYQARRKPDAFADDPLLSDNAMTNLASGIPMEQSPKRSALKGLSQYFSNVRAADESAKTAPNTGLGSLEALGALATGAIATPAGSIAGIGTEAARGLGLTDAKGEDVAQRVQNAMTYQPHSDSGKSQLGLLGALTAPLAESGADMALMPLASEMQALSTVRRMPKTRPEPVPTTRNLVEAADKAYDLSESAGVVIRPESTQRAADIFREVAKSENLGKLPPKLSEAVTILDERIGLKEPLSLKDADKVRQLIGDAMKSTDAADRRLAKIIQGRYDRYIETLKPNDILAGNTEQGVSMLNQARELYRRRKNSELMDTMERNAQRKGQSTFTQAGVEHALRKQFESLAGNEKKLRGMTPEQRTAIEKVAAPGMLQTGIRNLGKFDPTSGGMGSLVGLGTGGTAAWMAGVDPLLGLSLPVAGYAARRASTGLTNRNVNRAREALVGRGLPKAPTAEELGASLQNSGMLRSVGGDQLPIRVATRSADQLRSDLKRLVAQLQSLPVDQANAARIKAISQEVGRLQAELASAESRAGSP